MGSTSDFPDPWEDIPIPDAVATQDPLTTLGASIERLKRFHRDSGYDTFDQRELIPSGGCVVSQLDSLAERLGTELPDQYRLLLSNWRYLEIFDGFCIWEPVDGHYEPYISSEFRGSSHRLLGCGNCWRRADGDDLLIDLDDPSHPVLVWCHDFVCLEPVAPSLSLAVYRMVEFLVPENRYQAAVDSVRESVKLRNMPWWRRLLQL